MAERKTEKKRLLDYVTVGKAAVFVESGAQEEIGLPVLLPAILPRLGEGELKFLGMNIPRVGIPQTQIQGMHPVKMVFPKPKYKACIR